VPLDYTDRSIGNTTVAFIRLKAPGNAPQDILLNPGGPGGSGVHLFLDDSKDDLMSLTFY
jgi:hypothetical protein